MRIFLSVLCLIFPFMGFSQPAVISGVYPYGKEIAGTATDMKDFRLDVQVIPKALKEKKIKVSDTQEQLIIVRSGNLGINLNDSAYSLGKGSVVLIMPGDVYTIKNNSAVPVEYYLMQYTSKTAVDAGRGRSSGGSIVRDWDKIPYKPHDRGGRRDFFDRPTAMCKRFEMHVTTLNGSLKSHEPHTHRAEEIVLILEGNTEMQIEDKFYKAVAGDVIFLASNSLHAIRNEGTTPCTYFAFQWE
ncbi:MAG TPA: cupin domain-containing protein [Ohtaekwangia sp.]